MFQAVTDTPARAYQVKIRDEYLEELYQFDAGTVEQEIFAMAERGLVIVMTDRPETIFQKLGDAIESVTYLGPTVDLPEQPVYANHNAVGRTRSLPASEIDEFAEGFAHNFRSHLAHAWALAVRAGQLVMQPFFHTAGLAVGKILPDRARHAEHIGEEN